MMTGVQRISTTGKSYSHTNLLFSRKGAESQGLPQEPLYRPFVIFRGDEMAPNFLDPLNIFVAVLT
jgi:hypothetical protein